MKITLTIKIGAFADLKILLFQMAKLQVLASEYIPAELLP